ncbi:MAG: HAD-IIIA family hydrolase [Planctomycetes bacterium]|nr:HAD-IIIA family hydrolase [Planctomycetota bacterium]
MARGPGFVAMVLAGGMGTRLREVVADRPKPLALVDGAPFLQRLLDQLHAAGCRRAVLCTGHLAEQFVATFGERFGAMQLVHSVERAPLGTAGALRQALAHLDDDGALVVNGDSWCGLDVGAFVAAARVSAEPTLVAVDVDEAGRYGSLQLGARGEVLAFREKAAGATGPINAGIYWLPRAVLEGIAEGRQVSLEREVLPALVGHGLRAVRVAAPFLDIGVPADYARASEFFAAVDAGRARRLLVVDRDGTLIVERHYLSDPAAVELLPGVVEGLRRFQQHGYQIAIVSNQSGVGRGYFDEAAMHAVNDEVLQQLAICGVHVANVWCCTHRPDEGCACRKPAPDLLDAALQAAGCAPARCLVVGDKACDVDLGRRRGARTALVRTGYGRQTELERGCEPDVVVDDLEQLAALETSR